MAGRSVIFSSLILVTYGHSFYHSKDGLMSLAHLSSSDSYPILPYEHTLPLVHKNINNLNNAGNVTINEIKSVVDANIDTLNNAKNGNVVFNDIKKLSNSIHRSQKLLKNTEVVELVDINAAKEKVVQIVKKIKEVFIRYAQLAGKELDEKKRKYRSKKFKFSVAILSASVPATGTSTCKTFKQNTELEHS
ncbi:uncharacterized protein [Choristoneura fumiferana]|uniref:uncharacterized protein n=1 Tax=Choristoneura fumiferana TaxID=7141 RepID=UPI003D15DDA4